MLTKPKKNISVPVTMWEMNGELYADSRELARGLHLRHEKVIDKLDASATVFGAAFGIVRFQTAEPARPQDGCPMRFAYLTDIQAIGVATLARNTAAVVDFKAAIVIAFRDARCTLEARLRKPTRLELLEQMVEAEERTNTIKVETERMKRGIAMTLPTACADEEPDSAEEQGYSWEEVAAMCEEDGKPMRVERLLEILREDGVLIEGGENHNLPHQEYVDAGYFRVSNHAEKPDHHDAHVRGGHPSPRTGNNPGTDAG